MQVEPLIDPKTGLIDADVLLLVLLEDWSRHLELNTAHLKVGAQHAANRIRCRPVIVDKMSWCAPRAHERVVH